MRIFFLVNQINHFKYLFVSFLLIWCYFIYYELSTNENIQIENLKVSNIEKFIPEESNVLPKTYRIKYIVYECDESGKYCGVLFIADLVIRTKLI